MGTITDKLQKVLGTKLAIRQAIVSMGQAVAETEPFSAYADKIRAIRTGVETGDATAVAGDILSGKTAYVKGSKVSGTMPSVEQAVPSISVSASGLITASAAQSEGHVSAGTKSKTSQMTTQAAATITPGTSAKTAVAAGRWTTGEVKVAGSSNLVASNIRSGVNVFGITGVANIIELVSLTIINSTSRTMYVYYATPNNNSYTYSYIDSYKSVSVQVPKNEFFVIKFANTSGATSRIPTMENATNVLMSGPIDVDVYVATGNAKLTYK